MKAELKLSSEDLDDTEKLEACLRAEDLVFALKKIWSLVQTFELNPTYTRDQVKKIMEDLGVWHFVND